jgi:hypothetical protein
MVKRLGLETQRPLFFDFCSLMVKTDGTEQTQVMPTPSRRGSRCFRENEERER